MYDRNELVGQLGDMISMVGCMVFQNIETTDCHGGMHTRKQTNKQQGLITNVSQDRLINGRRSGVRGIEDVFGQRANMTVRRIKCRPEVASAR